MTKEVEQLKKELEAWKERSKTKQQIINMLKIQTQAQRTVIELLTKNTN